MMISPVSSASVSFEGTSGHNRTRRAQFEHAHNTQTYQKEAKARQAEAEEERETKLALQHKNHTTGPNNFQQTLAAAAALIVALSMAAHRTPLNSAMAEDASPTSSIPTSPGEEPTTIPLIDVGEAEPVLDPAIQARIDEFLRPPLIYNQAEKTDLDKSIALMSKNMRIDLAESRDAAFEQYGQYFHEILTQDIMDIAIGIASATPKYHPATNIMGVSDQAVRQANARLRREDPDSEPLDPKNPTDNMAIFALAMSENYNPDAPNMDSLTPYWDLALAAGAVYNPSDIEGAGSIFRNSHARLFGFDNKSRRSDLQNLVQEVGATDLIKGGISPFLLWPDYCSAQALVDGGASIPDLIKVGIGLEVIAEQVEGGPQYLAENYDIESLMYEHGVYPPLLLEYAPEEVIRLVGKENLIKYYDIDPKWFDDNGYIASINPQTLGK